jgi:two-component sensor histidine kinase
MTVDCEEGDEGLALRVSDDGIGLPAGARPDPGMGFRVMESLAAEIGARLGVENGSPGLTYRLALSGGVSAKLS